MKEYRKAKGVKEQYNSLEELRTAWGCKTIVKRTSDTNKLQAQREAFCGKHKCKACGQPMSYVGGNQMACQNPNCKGIKVERTLKDGTVITSYEVSYDLLDELGTEIAGNIFD